MKILISAVRAVRNLLLCDLPNEGTSKEIKVVTLSFFVQKCGGSRAYSENPHTHTHVFEALYFVPPHDAAFL